MSGPGAGFDYPPYEVTWLKRDALLFANSIGCTADELHFLFVSDLVKNPFLQLNYDRNSTQTLRFFLHIRLSCVSSSITCQEQLLTITAFKKDSQEVIDFYAAQASTSIPGVPKFDSRRVVDGQRLMTFLKPLPPTSAGKTFEIRSKVIGVYDKGKAGSVIETQQDLVDKASGEVYARAVGSAFFVGQGNWGGPKGPATENFPPPKGKQPDAVVSHQTTKESALLYRYVSQKCRRQRA
jgi:peroxisomal enoyl-CoA hydratase 2